MLTEKIRRNWFFNKKSLEPKMDWIHLDTDPLLKEKSLPFKDEITPEEEMYINRMVNYIDACYNDEYEKYKIRPGIAIAAPQVGLLKRIIYVHFNEEGVEHQYLLLNPEIIAKSQSHSYIPGGEGCLSVPQDVNANIERNYKIIVQAYDLLQNKEIQITATNLLSICLQHEIDHLDGILYTDRINKENPNHYEKDWVKVP